MPKTSTSRKRELIDTGTDKRYVRRDAKGHFWSAAARRRFSLTKQILVVDHSS